MSRSFTDGKATARQEPRPPIEGARDRARRWVCRLAGLLLAVLAGAGGLLQAQPIAEGGSPLYLIAVRESIQGLKGKKTTPAVAQSRAHARGQRGQTNRLAITPEFLRRYYYCTNCHAWHLRPTRAVPRQPVTNNPALRRAGTNLLVLPPNRAASRPPPRPAPSSQTPSRHPDATRK